MTSSPGSDGDSAPLALKLAAALLLLVAGAATGLAAVVLHGLWWGLLLAAVATLAVLMALGGEWWTRLPFGLGWVACLAAMYTPRAEGDFVIAGDLPGYALVGLAIVVFVVSVVTVARPRRVAGRTGGAPTYH